MAVSMVIINLFELSKVKGNMFQKLAKLSNFQEESIFFNSCHFQKIKKKKSGVAAGRVQRAASCSGGLLCARVLLVAASAAGAAVLWLRAAARAARTHTGPAGLLQG